LGRSVCIPPCAPVQAGGLTLFLSVSLRLDGLRFLKGYIENLALLLDDSDQGIRGGAIFVLGNRPAFLPEALVHLAGHLSDKNNSVNNAMTLAAALLKSGDPFLVQRVLTLVAQRPEMRIDVIQMLGLYGVTSKEALDLIHGGLQDSVADTQRVSVDAIGNLPKDVQKGVSSPCLNRQFGD
jgi:hypothetical protein